MFNNIRKWYIILIILFFAISIIYFLFLLIFGFINNKKDTVDISDVNSYINNSSTTMVTDYNLFCSLQNATENYISYLIQEKYEYTYSVLDKEMTYKYTKKEYLSKIKDYANNNFNGTYVVDDPFFTNNSNLVKAYKINDNSYLCMTKNYSNEQIIIGIRLYTKENKYKIFYVGL